MCLTLLDSVPPSRTGLLKIVPIANAVISIWLVPSLTVRRCVMLTSSIEILCINMLMNELNRGQRSRAAQETRHRGPNVTQGSISDVHSYNHQPNEPKKLERQPLSSIVQIKSLKHFIKEKIVVLFQKRQEVAVFLLF